jgi:hypothetical protein
LFLKNIIWGEKMEIKEIEATYSPGSATNQEDGFINNYPFFGVIDTFSAAYDPEQGGPILYDELSGGEKIKQIIINTFLAADRRNGLKDTVLAANKNIANFWKEQKIPLKRSDLLAGASFAFAKIMPDKKSIQIIQGGDCIAGWIHNFVDIGFTQNQAYGHVTEDIKIIAGIMKKNNGSRKGLWREFYKPFCRLRLRDQNQRSIETGFAILNGQPEVRYCWQKKEIPTKDLNSLLLFSDGFVPDFETGVTEDSIIKTIKYYRGGNLRDLLEEIRSIQAKQRYLSHTDFPEATALGIKFFSQPR